MYVYGEENGNSLQYSCLGNAVDSRALWATVYGVGKESDTTQQLNNCIHIPSILNLTPLLHSTPLAHLRATGWASVIKQLSTSYISIFYKRWCIYQRYFLSRSYPLLSTCVHKSILYVCIFIPSLQIGSSKPFL